MSGIAVEYPLVSVLVPCFNSERTVAETLESVLTQTWPNIEVIVVDDGSTDHSKDVVLRYEAAKIALLSQENEGAAAARNRALAIAKGEWTIFLDADDLLEPEFVTTQLGAAIAANADICFGDALMTWSTGRQIEMNALPLGVTIDFALSRILSDGWSPQHAILWKTTFLCGLGGWDEGMRRNDDGDLIARALLHKPAITSSTGSRAIYRQHDGPNRVSARKDWNSLECQARFCERLDAELAIRSDLPLAKKAIARAAHELAVEAYFLGFDDLGARAERLARQHGRLQPLPRTRLHKLGVTALGIRRKERISRFLFFIKGALARRF